MSKKRRTRTQKIRSAQRRQQLPKASPRAPDTSVQPNYEPIARSTSSQRTEKPTAAPTAKRWPLDLRLSLMIFGALIMAQMLLWIVFSFTNLDARLYSLIKL